MTEDGAKRKGPATFPAKINGHNSGRSSPTKRPERGHSGGDEVDALCAVIERMAGCVQLAMQALRAARAKHASRPQAGGGASAPPQPADGSERISKGMKRRMRRKRAQAARAQGDAAVLGEPMLTEEEGGAAPPPATSTEAPPPTTRSEAAKEKSFADALKSAWAKPPSTAKGAAKDNGHAIVAPKRELSPSQSPLKSKQARTSDRKAEPAANRAGGERPRMIVETEEDSSDEEDCELGYCIHNTYLADCTERGCVQECADLCALLRESRGWGRKGS